jgi:cyclic 2,3-diphosphoglycerate synthase
VAAGPVIALIDGEHHPVAVRDVLDDLERRRGLAGVVFCGGEEKLQAGALDDLERTFGRPVAVGHSPVEALRAVAGTGDATEVIDLADEPVLHANDRMRLAALALHLGLAYEAPGVRLEPPVYAPVSFSGPKLAVIGTGKRSGKTAVAGHLAGLLRTRGIEPVVVCMGRGGPGEPRVARPDTGLDELLALHEQGDHAASDYLEDAVLAGVATVGCRRVGGGPAGEPAVSNVAEGAALAVSLEPDALVFEGSGACIPPVEVERTACVVRPPLEGFDLYRLLRADLVLAPPGVEVEGRVVRFGLRTEPAEELPPGARVALFSTSLTAPDGLEPVVASPNLARREALAADLDRAATQGCDVYLTELKAAAIDTVAVRARAEGARVVFLRNRPVGVDVDLDAELLEFADA